MFQFCLRTLKFQIFIKGLLLDKKTKKKPVAINLLDDFLSLASEP